MSDPIVMAAICKRCENSFRFIKRSAGRPRLYCEPCRELEVIDNAKIHYLMKTKPGRERAA